MWSFKPSRLKIPHQFIYLFWIEWILFFHWKSTEYNIAMRKDPTPKFTRLLSKIKIKLKLVKLVSIGMWGGKVVLPLLRHGSSGASIENKFFAVWFCGLKCSCILDEIVLRIVLLWRSITKISDPFFNTTSTLMEVLEGTIQFQCWCNSTCNIISSTFQCNIIFTRLCTDFVLIQSLILQQYWDYKNLIQILSIQSVY